MSEALEQYKAFLIRNKGKLPHKHLRQSVNWFDMHAHELGSAQEKQAIRVMMCEAYKISPEHLKAAFLQGDMLREASKDDFIKLVPEGMCRNYVEWVKDTEPPTSFHFFSFLTVMGALMQRQAWIEQHMFQIWPPMQVMLVGPTAVRKTTAAQFAMKLGREAGEDRWNPITRITPERLITNLSNRRPSTGIMVLPELTSVINKKKYNEGFINLLTDLFDSPDNLPVETHVRDVETLKDVALSAIMCTNEEYAIRDLPESTFKGGFISRVIPAYEPVPDTSKLFPIIKPLDGEKRSQLVFDLVEIARVRGAVTLTHSAQRLYDKIYRKVRKELPHDPRMADWMVRMPSGHLLRIAMLLSVAESRQEKLFIDEHHVRQSNLILEWIIERLPKLFSFMGVTDVGEDSNRIIQVIFKNGGRIERGALMAKLYGRVTVTQMDERLRTLKQAGIVKEIIGGLFDDSHEKSYYKLLKRPEEIG